MNKSEILFDSLVLSDDLHGVEEFDSLEIGNVFKGKWLIFCESFVVLKDDGLVGCNIIGTHDNIKVFLKG